MRRRSDWTVLAGLGLALFAALAAATWQGQGPAWNYLLGVFVTVLIFALGSLGLSLEFGFTGLLNFGHVAFMAIGGYGTAILYARLESVATRFEGASVMGALALVPLALLVGAIVAMFALWALEKWVRNEGIRRRTTLIAAGTGGLLALVCLAAWWPLGATGARNTLVLLCALASILLAAAAGALLGLPTVRLREDYLAIVTLGAAEILKSVTVNEEGLTRGTLGIQRLQKPTTEWAATPAWESFADALGLRPVILVHAVAGLILVAVVYLILERLVRSPWGRVLKSIREDEEVAATLGKNVTWFKLQSLMIGSAVAAAAGILFTWHLSSVYPEHFPALLTFYMFIAVVVGGHGNHRGALAGALLLWGVFELARHVTLLEGLGFRDLAGPPQALTVGLLLILFVLFRPQGLLGRREELLHAK